MAAAGVGWDGGGGLEPVPVRRLSKRIVNKCGFGPVSSPDWRLNRRSRRGRGEVLWDVGPSNLNVSIS